MTRFPRAAHDTTLEAASPETELEPRNYQRSEHRGPEERGKPGGGGAGADADRAETPPREQ